MVELDLTTGISKNLMQNVHYNFMGVTKRSFIIWGAVIVVCIISFFVRGLSQSIDLPVDVTSLFSSNSCTTGNCT